MPVERIPGEKMYIDWVGDQPELLTDPSTGEIRKVHVFTTTLGFSSCVYAEIFLDEKLPSFINGVVHALECKFRINGAPFSRQRCKRLAPAVRCPFIACL